MPPPATRTVVAVQSSYVPWKGTFDLFRRADVVLLLDELQYTRRDWRNRNRIKTAAGLRWLTVPVLSRGRYHQRIVEAEIADPAWAERHWRTLAHAYGRAAGFRDVRPWLEPLYRECRETHLAGVNRRFLRALCDFLGISTPLHEAEISEAAGVDTDVAADASERIARLCARAGATTYLSGPTARAYLDERPFARAGIEVQWMSYLGYPEYPQLHGPFVNEVSALDLILNTGTEARTFLLGESQAPAKASAAASTVASISASPWAIDTNAASNWAGGR